MANGGGPWDFAEGLARRRPAMTLRYEGGDDHEARCDEAGGVVETIGSTGKDDAQVSCVGLLSAAPVAA